MPNAAAPRPLGPLRWHPAKHPLIMGVINVTPDSFSDGGEHLTENAALAHAKQLAEEGAHILDIGGESTRPGASLVEEQEELQRVLPAIRAIASADLGRVISIDTYKARIADKALDAGAHVVNDVWGLQREPDIAKAAAAHHAPVIINHWEKEPDADKDLITQMKAFFDRSIEIALKAGVDEDLIILDPGIGFGKSVEDNLLILSGLDQLHAWGYPLLIGTSRKRFIGHITGREPKDRVHGTVASNVLALTKGATIFRVHDVAAHKDALAVAHAIHTYPGS
ncbi:dihydropteroate synthase [Cohaesibacter sp. ES.047]|uniref:dihydropteroate synthase n=1 Tax=Cohaesibacter sp. ES.047 TaxID=1798205 RepID=UPI000BBF6895|nr:dihydropteroate synthase [Cohaesibacter sp. ES.047]SNY93975.1 dihydropteroate synthase [Cohaesibacter sp. ES.047]